MFGWEFPPHISGGLGTACEGMTRALSHAGVDIILVVPKLHGDEKAAFTMLSASEVAIPSVVRTSANQIVNPLNSKDDGLHQVALAGSWDVSPTPIIAEMATLERTPDLPHQIESNVDNSNYNGNKEQFTSARDTTIRETVKGEITGLSVYSTLQPYAPSPRPVRQIRYAKQDVQELGVRLDPFARGPERATLSAEKIFKEHVELAADEKSDAVSHSLMAKQTIGAGGPASADILAAVHSRDSLAAHAPRERIETDAETAEGFMYYPFSGRYDQDLHTEIERFGDVAREVASAYEFDLIHAHDWMTFKAGLAAREASGKKLVLHVHATEVDRTGSRTDSRIFAMEKQGMLACDHIIAVSNWTKQILISHYEIDPDKITVVHNGVRHQSGDLDVSRSNPLRVPVVSFVGRITYQKGPMYFIEAAYKVLQKVPDVHFVVAGSGDQLTQVIDQVAHLRVGDNFSFTGFLKRSDVDRLWAMSDLYVMPSVSEPFGITPLEAARAGVPVILSKQSGVSEVLPHAMKVDFWDTDALANAICSVLSYPILARVMSANATSELSTITWERAADRIMSVYEELLAVSSPL